MKKRWPRQRECARVANVSLARLQRTIKLIGEALRDWHEPEEEMEEPGVHLYGDGSIWYEWRGWMAQMK